MTITGNEKTARRIANAEGLAELARAASARYAAAGSPRMAEHHAIKAAEWAALAADLRTNLEEAA